MPTSSCTDIRLGITMGDPAGIGPEIILKALPVFERSARLFVIGDSWVLRQVRGIARRATDACFIDVPNVDRRTFRFGTVRASCGRASLDYLDRALELLRAGSLDCLVTAPISKDALYRCGCRFTGHTEYLKARTGASSCAMMLMSGDARFVLATRHIPLRSVCRRLSTLPQTVTLAYESLRSYFGIAHPRIVVCGLNPHASDNGVIGNEEATIIAPVLGRLRRRMPGITGPLPADVAIGRAFKGAYDCVIALYHDQALIPLKLTGADRGVNVTLGLPFVRTSPLHGTAFDIAGRNKARPESMCEAIRVALSCHCRLRLRQGR